MAARNKNLAVRGFDRPYAVAYPWELVPPRSLSLSLARALSFSLSALGRQSGSGVWWFLARKRCSIISRASGVVQGGRRTSLARRASVGLPRPGRAMIAVTMVWVCVARRLEAHYA